MRRCVGVYSSLNTQVVLHVGGIRVFLILSVSLQVAHWVFGRRCGCSGFSFSSSGEHSGVFVIGDTQVFISIVYRTAGNA